jgi:hypothetical protein
MIQSHLIQLTLATLSIFGMKKDTILKDIIFSGNTDDVVFGQYVSYRYHTPEVAHSKTETLVAMRLNVSHDGLHFPILLRSGKKLHKKSTTIHVTFTEQARKEYGYESLTVDITRDEVYLEKDGVCTMIHLESQDFCRRYHLDAHEALFLDVMEGDRTFFLTPSEILGAWEIIDPVVALRDPNPLYTYADASKGVPEQDTLTPWYEPISRSKISRYEREKEMVTALRYDLGILFEKKSPDDAFRVAMSGGSVIFFLDILTEFSDRCRIEVYQVDERYVPYDHPDSNARVICDKLQDTNIEFRPFPILSSVQESAEKYREILENTSLDLVIL